MSQLKVIVQIMKISPFVVGTLFYFAGCASKDAVCRGVYDGLTRHPMVDSSPGATEPPLDEPMSYDRYKYERERILGRDRQELELKE